jgi:hypothetical protein
MTEERAHPDLAELVRDLHIHFEVEPEVIVQGSERVKVGFEVRLWAVHPRGARALPGCEKCRDLAAELRRIATWAIPSEHRPTRVEIEPFRPALYDSREVLGADEVALAIRLIHREGWDRPVDPCEERCLKEIRQRLRSLGIQER